VDREVILCGGAFNTPQLLMLSGIGPQAELARHGIATRIDLPGVGRNLQDRYEVGVVARASAPFRLLKDASFKGRKRPGDPDPDRVFKEWREEGEGIYATNGAVLGVVMRSSTRKRRDPPDLYLFGVPGPFEGYRIGYAEAGVAAKDRFTWCVLKGHTDNTSGYVKLRSSDPFATPEIHFKYFEESEQPDQNDVQSVVDGVEFALKMYDRLKRQGVVAEVLDPAPGADLHQFVRDRAWGHHASCTCKIGAEGDRRAVLDQDFRVRGASNLRVVDASVFPRIPGLFILTSIYMVSEKASDVLIAQHK
jgi:choline dehydrogenase